MSADSVLAEALARVEHKLDVLISLIAMGGLAGKFAQMGAPDHTCPLCHQQVKYQVDIFKGVVTRQCGCSTGLQAPLDLTMFSPPQPLKKENTDGRDEDQGSGNTDRGNGNRRR